MKQIFIAFAVCLFSVSAFAEVTKVDVITRTDIANGYEQITAKVHFAVDPKDPRNAVIADIDKAPKGADGRVEFTSDMLVLRPKTGGNGVALVDVVNRGGTTFLRLNRTAGQNLVGDGFLMKQGFTIIAIGWEFDVAARNTNLRIEVPVATDNGAPITGIVRAAFIADRRDTTHHHWRCAFVCASGRQRSRVDADGTRQPLAEAADDSAR